MNTRYKIHYLYLILVILIIAPEMFLMKYIVAPESNGFTLKLLTIGLLAINSTIFYELIYNFFQKSHVAVLVSALYILAPTHFDNFLFFFQVQSLVAELVFLMALMFFQKQHHKKAIALMVGAILFNSKLIPIMLIMLFYKKISLRVKVYCSTFLLIYSLYLSPLFFKQFFFLKQQFKTLFYIGENLIFPMNNQFLDLSILTPNYYGYTVIIFSSFVIGGVFYFCRNAHVVVKYSGIILLASCASFIIPYKQVFQSSGDYFYYYLPTFYPGVTIAFLLILSFLVAKFDSRKAFYLVVFFIGSLWSLSNVNVYINSKDAVASWDNSLTYLPTAFHHEEVVKFEYVEMLIANNKLDKAEKYLQKNLSKFPLLSWYRLWLTIAGMQNDQYKIQKILIELSDKAIPFENTQ